MKVIQALIFLVIAISCEENPYDCVIDESVLARNDSIMQLDNFNDGYKPILEEMEEPEFESLKVKAYRLVVMYSWDRDTWVYRFEKTNEGGLLTLKKTYTESQKNYLGISDSTITKVLNMTQWNEIEKVFDSNCFWTQPLSIDRRGLDGRTCILEACDPDRQNPVGKDYFIAARWSPESNTEFRNICDKIESWNQSE